MKHASVSEVRDEINSALEQVIAGWQGPRVLVDAMRYSLMAGGKRFRPILVVSASQVVGGGGIDPVPAACAVEMVHTYSLIHDDLPAMDDDDYRRGKPTCHLVFGECLAVLSGDALLTDAFTLIVRSYSSRPELASSLVRELSTAAGSSGMVAGQVLDTDPGAREAEGADLERVHHLKTGALLRACVRMGALIGGASERDVARMDRYGMLLGLAFQVVDDCLDATGDLATLGKDPGSDREAGKVTYVDIMGVDGARDYARSLIDDALDELKDYGERAVALRWLARRVVERTC
ncbi:MAG: polyprenyl synthetase family protein [Deltaproteobacteria bacterium]|nr:polyprenyl synthetase family protein [Deltaproteobacteria bacterium]